MQSSGGDLPTKEWRRAVEEGAGIGFLYTWRSDGQRSSETGLGTAGHGGGARLHGAGVVLRRLAWP
jgi:hypothetical protein